jgi:hypothetical protein
MMQIVEFVSLKHVCAIYSKTPTQVRYAVAKGRLKAEKHGGWELKFRVSDLPSQWPEPPRNMNNLSNGGS